MGLFDLVSFRRLPADLVPHLIYGGGWGFFCFDGCCKVADAWAKKPQFEKEFTSPPTIPRKVTSASYCISNFVMIIDWFMRYRGYALIFSSIQLLPFIGNIGYVISYAAQAEEGPLNMKNLPALSDRFEKIALRSERQAVSQINRHLVSKISCLSFGIFALLSVVGELVKSSTMMAAASGAMVVFTATTVVILSDFILNTNRRPSSQLWSRLTQAADVRA